MHRRSLVLGMIALAVVAVSGLAARADALDARPRGAMILWRGATRAEEGFVDRLQALGVDAELEVFDSGQDASRLESYLDEFRPGDYDFIYAFGTTVSQKVAERTHGAAPLVFNIVAYPVEAGLVESMDRCGRNVCGVSNSVPMAAQLEFAHTVVPFTTLAALYTEDEGNAVLAADALEQAARVLGLRMARYPVSSGDGSLDRALTSIMDPKSGIGAAYLPTDSYLASRAGEVVRRLAGGRVPVVAAIEAVVREGALLGLVSGYYGLGVQAADMVAACLRGKPLADMAVERPGNPREVVNLSTAREIGVDIPRTTRNSAELLD